MTGFAFFTRMRYTTAILTQTGVNNLRVKISLLVLCLLLCLAACSKTGGAGGTTAPSAGESATYSGEENTVQSTNSSGTPGTGANETNTQDNTGAGTSNRAPGATGETGSASASQTQATAQGATQRETVSVLVAPGMNFVDIAKRLEKNGVCTVKAFYSAAQSYTVQSFTIPSSADRCFRMEGYLQADTYHFYKNDDPVRVLKTMLNNYSAKSGMPSDKTLIIASLIEREARSFEHMQKVSAVIHNRLAKGNMKLDLSCTYDYAVVMRDFLSAYTNESNPSRYKDLYNTYNAPMVGKLPAGPICSPSANAIKAAKNPAKIEALYFYFGVDGNNHYSNTYEEHLEKMKDIPANTSGTTMQ